MDSSLTSMISSWAVFALILGLWWYFSHRNKGQAERVLDSNERLIVSNENLLRSLQNIEKLLEENRK